MMAKLLKRLESGKKPRKQKNSHYGLDVSSLIRMLVKLDCDSRRAEP